MSIKGLLRAVGKFLVKAGAEELQRRAEEKAKKAREWHATKGGPRFYGVLLSLLLLGACTGVKLPDLDCRVIPCGPGFKCEPDPSKISQWHCVPVPSESPSPTPPVPSASPSVPVPSPSPEPVPSPSPVPSPGPIVPSPGTSPTPAPTPEPTPTPAPSPTPEPVPSPTPKPPKKVCDPKYAAANQCVCCDVEIAFEQSRARLLCPDGWPGSDIGTVNLDGEHVTRGKYDPAYGRGMCHSTSSRSRYLVDRKCIKHTIDGNPVGPAFEKLCPWPPAPQPSPSATPTPGPAPTPGPTPSPASSNDATLYRVGLGEKIQNIVKGKHGTRYIINSTPRSRRPFCEYTTEKALWEAHKAGDRHALGELTPAQEATYRAKEAAGTLADGVEAQRIECEQHPSRQDPRGPKGYQTHLGGKFTNHDLEQNSGNPYLFQIKISDPAEAGDYLIRVCPYDDPITSPRCSERIYRGITP